MPENYTINNFNIQSANPLNQFDLTELENFTQNNAYFLAMHNYLIRNHLPTNILKRIGSYSYQPVSRGTPIFLFAYLARTRAADDSWIVRIPIPVNNVKIYFPDEIVSDKARIHGETINKNGENGRIVNYFIPSDPVNFIQNIDDYLKIDMIRHRIC
jgi:hypothetical protein